MGATAVWTDPDTGCKCERRYEYSWEAVETMERYADNWEAKCASVVFDEGTHIFYDRTTGYWLIGEDSVRGRGEWR